MGGGGDRIKKKKIQEQKGKGHHALFVRGSSLPSGRKTR